MQQRCNSWERLEDRVVLDASSICPLEYPDSSWVSEAEDGTLRFASLNVGKLPQPWGTGGTVLADEDIITVGDHPISVKQTKALLHGFADSLGTDLIIETLDLRVSTWGSGSGSTSSRFEAFMLEQLESQVPCEGLRFAGPVRFTLPGEGGEFFTGGFLDLEIDGSGSLLQGGDAVFVLSGYEIEASVLKTTLTVHSDVLGEVVFQVQHDGTLTDEFKQVWYPAEDEYQIVDPNAVDTLLGDLDGNGAVDFGDFLTLSANFNQETSIGDLDDDGKVTFADFLILSDNFGKTLER